MTVTILVTILSALIATLPSLNAKDLPDFGEPAKVSRYIRYLVTCRKIMKYIKFYRSIAIRWFI